ncbi:hypothetical protein HOLleu_27751 [Holothuria leucospilota]|uniref:Uncharacterized protein n=1 Tax=Holothuria leucospilota TaxID=206669 RepID=A0A9Q1H2J7_HOLLE|nr:hypothetical protein HOLleu_27751 [Holothuria leucospilota]
MLEFFATKEIVLIGARLIRRTQFGDAHSMRILRNDSAKSETVDIMSEFDDVFTGLGCVKDVIYHIMVDLDVPPVVHPPRKIPVALRAKVKEELKRMEELDVIEKVTRPTQWVSRGPVKSPPSKVQAGDQSSRPLAMSPPYKLAS